MSLDIFFVAFKGGESAPFDRSIALNAFGKLVEPWNDGWVVKYSDGNYYGGTLRFDEAGANLVTGFSMNRPPFSPELLEGFLKIMRQVPSVLCFPDGDVWGFSADPNIHSETPRGMFKRPEQCAIVATVDEFAEAAGLSWSENS